MREFLSQQVGGDTDWVYWRRPASNLVRFTDSVTTEFRLPLFSGTGSVSGLSKLPFSNGQPRVFPHFRVNRQKNKPDKTSFLKGTPVWFSLFSSVSAWRKFWIIFSLCSNCVWEQRCWETSLWGVSVFCVFVEKFCLACWRSDWIFERPRLEWKHNEKLSLFAFFKLPWCFKWNRPKMEKALEAACRMISDVWWLWERFPWADVAADAREIDWPVAWVCLEYLTGTVS